MVITLHTGADRAVATFEMELDIKSRVCQVDGGNWQDNHINFWWCVFSRWLPIFARLKAGSSSKPDSQF